MPAHKKKEPRIPPKDFVDITEAIFTKGNDFTGVRIAAHMGLKQFQLWMLVKSRGLTTGEARMFADALDQWAIELIGKARKMRQLATELEGGTLPPMISLAQARRAARAHVYKSDDLEPGTLGGAEIIGDDNLPAEERTPESASEEPVAEPFQSAEPATPALDVEPIVTDVKQPTKRTRSA